MRRAWLLALITFIFIILFAATIAFLVLFFNKLGLGFGFLHALLVFILFCLVLAFIISLALLMIESRLVE